jgi:hypothetical protein
VREPHWRSARRLREYFGALPPGGASIGAGRTAAPPGTKGGDASSVAASAPERGLGHCFPANRELIRCKNRICSIARPAALLSFGVSAGFGPRGWRFPNRITGNAREPSPEMALRPVGPRVQFRLELFSTRRGRGGSNGGLPPPIYDGRGKPPVSASTGAARGLLRHVPNHLLPSFIRAQAVSRRSGHLGAMEGYP